MDSKLWGPEIWNILAKERKTNFDHVRISTKKTGRKGLWNYIPHFTFPKDDTDKLPIVSEIVRELEKRDFQVPDAEVKFHLSGTGENCFKHVSTIAYSDIYMFFCRNQGPMPKFEDGKLTAHPTTGWNALLDVAALRECRISKHYVTFNDERNSEVGDTYAEYLGNSWQNDMTNFNRSIYTAEREGLAKRVPYVKEKHQQIFVARLQEFLDLIKSYPEVESRAYTESLAENIEDFRRLTFTPYPEHYPKLYCVLDSLMRFHAISDFMKEYKDTTQWDKRKVQFDRKVLIDNYWRPSKVRDQYPYPDIATDAFVECFDHNYCMTWMKELDEEYEKIIERNSVLDTGGLDYLFIELQPHYLDDIYVADLGPSRDFVKQCPGPDDGRLTTEEIMVATALKGARIVTFQEYVEQDMHFEHSQILIRRSLGYDEVAQVWLKYHPKGLNYH